MKFENYQLGKHKCLLSKEFTRVLALANHSSSDGRVNANDQSTEYEHQCETGQNETDQQLDQADPQNIQDPDVSILSVKAWDQKVVKKVKKDTMPTWASTKSLLLSHTSSTQTLTNTEVLSPLFRTSPTDYATLYTVLMLTQGISAFVVGPARRTLITLDLDLYQRALKIQQSVGNSNWVLRA